MRKTKETVSNEIYSEHIGLRFRPSQHTSLKKWAEVYHLAPAVFVRQLILNKLEDLDSGKTVKIN